MIMPYINTLKMFYEMLQVGFMKAFTIIKSFGTLGVKGLTAATQPKQIKH